MAHPSDQYAQIIQYIDDSNSDTCLVCQEVLTMPVQPVKNGEIGPDGQICECRYYLCRECSRAELDSCRVNHKDPVCYICKMPIGGMITTTSGRSSHAYFQLSFPKAISLDRRYAGKPEGKVSCSNAECKWAGSRIEFELEHEMVCPTKRVYCPNSKLGCRWHGLRRNLKSHLDGSADIWCKYVLVNCPGCDVMFERYHLMFEHDCPSELIQCVTCRDWVKRCDFDDHSQKCIYEFPEKAWAKIAELQEQLDKVNLNKSK